MEERVLHLGGRLLVESQPGRGTMVSFELPLVRFPGPHGTERGPGEDPGALDGDQVQINPFRTA
jgi:hypothetical protein